MSKIKLIECWLALLIVILLLAGCANRPDPIDNSFPGVTPVARGTI